MPFKETVNDPSSKNGSPPNSQAYPWNLYLIHNVKDNVVFLAWKVFNAKNLFIVSEAWNAKVTFVKKP